VREALTVVALANLLLAGCATPGERPSPENEIRVLTLSAEQPTEFSEGSPAAGGTLLVHLVRRAAWPHYREFVDSGLADFVAPPRAERGSIVTIEGGQNVTRVEFLLDGRGETSFRFEGRDLVVRLEVSGGTGTVRGSCRPYYLSHDPVDRDIPPGFLAEVPFRIACDSGGS